MNTIEIRCRNAYACQDTFKTEIPNQDPITKAQHVTALNLHLLFQVIPERIDKELKKRFEKKIRIVQTTVLVAIGQ